ncbi:Gfo/Idh/MocA family protein [Streptomyces oceani]|uniref:Oxidoreductase n=1 Tax=Streptomyces oceani TaxID=1075402 RepID=A0A1E7KET6_9ACTN|nr:Gfo/Idh/MocA family oxidoreductase [Streptomyces oceani]OEV02428.1 oxidoreductase [Streptomyces oceani]
MRVGLLGSGPWAARTHGPALRTHPEAELVGVWGRRPEAARELATDLGCRPYGEVTELLSDCDAVAIALPPDVQAPLAVQAAESGCHLLLDKPLATTRAGAEQVRTSAERVGIASVVFFTLHFSEPTGSWIRRQRQDGEWLLGRADWLSPVFGGGDTPYGDSPWRREKGALWDVGPHALSVLLPLLGEVSQVRATAGPGDTVQLALRHEGGAASTVTVSHTVPPQAAGVSAEVRGAPGVATLPLREEEPADAFGRAIDALLEAVRTGRAHECDVRFGAEVTDVLTRAAEQLS